MRARPIVAWPVDSGHARSAFHARGGRTRRARRVFDLTLVSLVSRLGRVGIADSWSEEEEIGSVEGEVGVDEAARSGDTRPEATGETAAIEDGAFVCPANPCILSTVFAAPCHEQCGAFY